MKNIHILPTDKPSRLFKAGIEFIFDISEVKYTERYKELHNYINHNIYITSDEEIKEGDWFYEPINNCILKYDSKSNKLIKAIFSGLCKKIILTTDQDLIKDGVQAIDDEFLEWFVKNPSCQKILIGIEIWNDGGFSYRIIIPKEEPKQETLEEVAKNYSKGWGEYDDKKAFIEGAKWQQEQYKKIYSQLVDLLEELKPIYREDSYSYKHYELERLEIIKQFKNK